MRIYLSLCFAAAFAAGCASTPKPGQAGDPGPQGDKGAPLLVGTDAVASLPVAEAWAVLSDVAHWSDWNASVLSPTAASGLTPGAQVAWVWQGKAVTAMVEEVKEGGAFTLKGAATGPAVGLRWTLRALSPENSSISLRAALKTSASEAMKDSAMAETQAWIVALNAELARRVAAKPKPLSKPKPKKGAK